MVHTFCSSCVAEHDRGSPVSLNMTEGQTAAAATIQLLSTSCVSLFVPAATASGRVLCGARCLQDCSCLKTFTPALSCCVFDPAASCTWLIWLAQRASRIAAPRASSRLRRATSTRACPTSKQSSASGYRVGSPHTGESLGAVPLTLLQLLQQVCQWCSCLSSCQ